MRRKTVQVLYGMSHGIILNNLAFEELNKLKKEDETYSELILSLVAGWETLQSYIDGELPEKQERDEP